MIKRRKLNCVGQQAKLAGPTNYSKCNLDAINARVLTRAEIGWNSLFKRSLDNGDKIGLLRRVEI